MSDPVDTRPHGRGAAEAPEPRDGRGELPTPPSGVNLRSVAYHGKSAIAVLISLAVLVGGGWFAMTKLQSGIEGFLTAEDYRGPGETEILVEVPSGSSVSEIGALLVEKDVIKSTEAWRNAVRNRTDEVNLQAGYYQLLTQMSAAQALDRMLAPDALKQEKVTIREGLRIGEQYEALAKATGMSVEEFEAAAKDGKSYGLSPWAEGNPEGFLFPDTYNVQVAAGPTPVLAAMAGQFDKVAGDIDLEKRANELGRSPREIVTVASIIEEEVRRDEDRPKVARVLYNRLDKGMKLQLDTTVMYANNKRGGASTSEEMRKNPSPYNTYVADGLPPGPIAAPGKAALEAAANPADGNWLYFVAVNLETGETKFADDAAGHQRNVETWRRWCSENKGKC